MSRSYNGFSAEERNRVGEIQVALLRRFPEYRQTVCMGCGMGRGVVQHLEDYTEPLKGIIGLCTRCHVMIHERFRYPEQFARYAQAIADGWVFTRGAHWRAVLQDCCWGAGAYRGAVPGPERGPTVLDDIATGKYLHLGGDGRTYDPADDGGQQAMEFG